MIRPGAAVGSGTVTVVPPLVIVTPVGDVPIVTGAPSTPKPVTRVARGPDPGRVIPAIPKAAVKVAVVIAATGTPTVVPRAVANAVAVVKIAVAVVAPFKAVIKAVNEIPPPNVALIGSVITKLLEVKAVPAADPAGGVMSKVSRVGLFGVRKLQLRWSR